MSIHKAKQKREDVKRKTNEEYCKEGKRKKKQVVVFLHARTNILLKCEKEKDKKRKKE